MTITCVKVPCLVLFTILGLYMYNTTITSDPEKNNTNVMNVLLKIYILLYIAKDSEYTEKNTFTKKICRI